MTLMKNYYQPQKTLRDLVERYKQKKISFDKHHEILDNKKEDDNFIETSIFDHLAFNIFVFAMAIISVIRILDNYNMAITNIVMHFISNHRKVI